MNVLAITFAKLEIPESCREVITKRCVEYTSSVIGLNPIPAPETLSDQAKLVWTQLPQVLSPVNNARQFTAVREFTLRKFGNASAVMELGNYGPDLVGGACAASDPPAPTQIRGSKAS